MVEAFEKEFAAFCQTKRGGSGQQRYRCSSFRPDRRGRETGDVVVTVSNTFIATTEAISQAGALPEFVDIDERTYNMGSEKLRCYLEAQCTVSADGKLISKRSNRPVTAIVPVHLYGQMADMDPILELAEQYRLIVIEDACQAHGAEYFSRRLNRWFKAGSMGRAAAFSFYPGKNLGACGEGGAVTTNDPGLADLVKMLRDHGQAKKYYHDVEGYNGRLDAIQTGILSVKSKHLPEWNAKRRQRAEEYNRLFAASEGGVQVPFEPSWSRAVYHLYVVRTADREGLMTSLKNAGIGTGIHYPIPLHLQRAYESLGYKKDSFPVTESVSETIVSLPMFPHLTAEQQSHVTTRAREFVHAGAVTTA